MRMVHESALRCYETALKLVNFKTLAFAYDVDVLTIFASACGIDMRVCVYEKERFLFVSDQTSDDTV